ncbi:unnamed protein product [Peniophora sp. CBMAI 1063]|nr:unnamed protein product [Peniophora sp. CBMAI 1063]
MLAATLPDDIIIGLFNQAALIDQPSERDDNERTLPNLGWINLTHVCRQWRTVGIECMAPLWASIVTTFGTHTIANMIEHRARGCNLTLRVTKDGASYPRSRRVSMVDWSLERMSRAQKIEFIARLHFNTSNSALHAAFDGVHLPSLTYLDVCSAITPLAQFEAPAGATIVSHLRDVRFETPNLVVAHMSNILPSPSSSLQSLRRLRLMFPTFRVNITMTHIVNCLLSLPRIEDLSLDCPKCSPEEDPYKRGIRDLNLNHLVTLCLKVSDADDAITLLETLHAPFLSKIKTTIAGQMTDDDSQCRLLNNSLSRYVEQLHFDIASFSNNGLRLSLSVINKDTLASEHEDVFELWLLSDCLRPRGYHTLTLFAEASSSLFKSVTSCCLDCLGHSLDSAELAPSYLVLPTTSVIRRLGRCFPNASSIRLSELAIQHIAFDVMKEEPPDLFFPSMRFIIMDVTKYGNLICTRESAKEWWGIVREALRNRSGKNRPLAGLILEDDWGTSTLWYEVCSAEAEENRRLGLVAQVIDRRKHVTGSVATVGFPPSQ